MSLRSLQSLPFTLAKKWFLPDLLSVCWPLSCPQNLLAVAMAPQLGSWPSARGLCQAPVALRPLAEVWQELFSGFLENYREGLPAASISREISVSWLHTCGVTETMQPLSSGRGAWCSGLQLQAHFLQHGSSPTWTDGQTTRVLDTGTCPSGWGQRVCDLAPGPPGDPPGTKAGAQRPG